MGPGMTFDLAASLTIGFLGSFHCLGMCGPIILAFSLHMASPQIPPHQDNIRASQGAIHRHVAFHLGRLLTYGSLGALAGLFFSLANPDRLFLHLRSGMTLLGGILMIFLGLVLIRAIQFPGVAMFSSLGVGFKASLGRLLTSQSIFSKMVLGMAVGFLPCGLSWAMIVKAATAQNMLAGFLIMVAFGLGTVPALFLPGISASIVSLRLRIVGERLAALSVIAMGLMLVLKGAKFFA